jgi:hypothetical protein
MSAFCRSFDRQGADGLPFGPGLTFSLFNRRKIVVTKLSFVAVFAATVAGAQPAAQAPAADPSQTSANPAAAEKKICRNLPTTGTRLQKRACLTAKEWQELDQENR